MAQIHFQTKLVLCHIFLHLQYSKKYRDTLTVISKYQAVPSLVITPTSIPGSLSFSSLVKEREPGIEVVITPVTFMTFYMGAPPPPPLPPGGALILWFEHMVVKVGSKG